jgi:glycosyltransferase involved in cell wall biosynthesis
MPIYNVAPFVEHALTSALDQSYPNLEIILVDDRGSDNSMDIVHATLNAHPHPHTVRIITHPTNLGTGAARNSAIDAANGSFLFFMDSDDSITPDCIQLLYDQMLRTPVDFVQAHITSSRFTPPHTPPDQQPLIQTRKESMIDILKVIYTVNRLYSTAFLRNHHIRCIPNHRIEDIYFTTQVAVHANAFAIIPNITYIYRDWTASGHAWTPAMFNALPEIFALQLQAIRDANLPPHIRRAFKRKAFWLRLTLAQAALHTFKH